MATRIGFIGLGIMGRPMVRNLANAGYEIIVYNRSQDDIDEVLSDVPQATAAASARAVAEQVDTVITMLPDSPEVSEVVFGETGILPAMNAGDLLIDMSTIAPATAIAVNTALAERGASALDAPVSGGDKGAIAATLSIMVGGSAADFDRAMPLFEAMGKTIVHVGGPGAGQTVKACNQIVVAIHYAAVSEALLLGARAGVDPEKVVQVLSGGLAASRVMEMRGPGMIAHQFEPGFRIDLHRKDLNIAMSTGREFQAPLPVSALVTQLYESMAARGDGQLDHSALVTLYEDLAGFKIGE
ncbi:MAG: 2-hydroxy-3-oxopropionate reductase [Thermomicrobiales bacterium]|nr:2-hydroxy-3-oxopropionate reductase [Thermomicrobiales bacterium]